MAALDVDAESIVADLFSAIMVAITGLIGFTVTLYSLSSIDDRREQFGYYPLVSILLMGISGAFLTGDMFTLYVWFEVLLISSFVLLALGGERDLFVELTSALGDNNDGVGPVAHPSLQGRQETVVAV